MFLIRGVAFEPNGPQPHEVLTARFVFFGYAERCVQISADADPNGLYSDLGVPSLGTMIAWSKYHGDGSFGVSPDIHLWDVRSQQE